MRSGSRRWLRASISRWSRQSSADAERVVVVQEPSTLLGALAVALTACRHLSLRAPVPQETVRLVEPVTRACQ